MLIFFSSLILLASVLLILVVIVQNSKGGGLAANFSSSNQILGVRKTTDFLEKATWTLAGAIVVLSLLYNMNAGHSGTVEGQSRVQEQLEKSGTSMPAAPVAPAADDNE